MDILSAVLANPILFSAVGAVVLIAVVVFAIAVFQGREVSFWPPKIGPRSRPTSDIPRRAHSSPALSPIDKSHFTWDDVNNGILSLAKSVRGQFLPDIVVSTSRGGAVIAAAVAKQLDCDFVAYRFREEQYESATGRVIRLKWLTTMNLKGKKVLFVSDAMRTGQLAQESQRVIREAQPLELRTAVLVWAGRTGASLQERGSVFKPDFYAFVTNRVDYIFPWAVTP